jgi:molybdopterin converting factor small subunit
MNVEVQLFAYLRKEVAGLDRRGRKSVALPDGAKAGDVVLAIGLDSSRYKLLVVNNVHSDESAPLADGDRVAIFPAIAGG